MKHRRLAQWKIFYRLGQRSRGVGPRFVQLNQGRFNLGRMQRIGGFLFDPARSPHGSEDAAKLDEILLSIRYRQETRIKSSRSFRVPEKEGDVRPGSGFAFRCAKFFPVMDRLRVR